MLTYNLLVRLYGLIIRMASPKNPKAMQWVKGRKDWRKKLETKMKALESGKRIWVHCASYGEFEQGRPLIDAIKIKYPQYKIILTFFSPSGYEAFKDWKGADVVCYLPLDTKRNARDFIGIVNPATVIFIKYEFWLNFLFELKKMQIQVFLVSAVFKPHHPFFKWYGNIFRRSLATFEKLFIQDTSSGKLLAGIGIKNFEVSGDTRFDRVLEIKRNFKGIPLIEKFKGSDKLIIAGSTWPKDEELLLNAFCKLKDENVKLLIAPHNVDEKSVAETIQKINNFKLPFALYTNGEPQNARILVLNVMGLLSGAYHYADCAYIGGAFNEGLHNSLEAAVFGIPVTFYGDDFSKYNEVVDLAGMGAAVNVKDGDELTATFSSFLSDDELRQTIREKLSVYFKKNSEISAKVLGQITL